MYSLHSYQGHPPALPLCVLLCFHFNFFLSSSLGGKHLQGKSWLTSLFSPPDPCTQGSSVWSNTPPDLWGPWFWKRLPTFPHIQTAHTCREWMDFSNHAVLSILFYSGFQLHVCWPVFAHLKNKSSLISLLASLWNLIGSTLKSSSKRC